MADGRLGTPKKVERSGKTTTTEPGKRSTRKTTSSMTPSDSEMPKGSDTTIDAPTKKAASMGTSATGTLRPASKRAVRSKAAGVLEPVPLPPDVPAPPMPLQQSPPMDLEEEEEEEAAETPAPLRSELQAGAAARVVAPAGGRRSSKAPMTAAGQGLAVPGGPNGGAPSTCEDGASLGRGSPQEASFQGKQFQPRDLGTTHKTRRSWVPTANDIEEVSWADVQDEQGMAALMARRQSHPKTWAWQPPDEGQGRGGKGPTMITGRLHRASLFNNWRQTSPTSRLGLREAVDHSKVLYPDPAMRSKESTATRVTII